VKRAVAFALLSSTAILLVAAGPPTRSTLEIFGVGAGDAIEIDGQAVAIKSAVSHPFSGQPLPGDAPAITLLSAGTHDVTLHLAGCAPRTFSVDVQGAYHHTIVVAPAVTARCSVPSMPPRAP